MKNHDEPDELIEYDEHREMFGCLLLLILGSISAILFLAAAQTVVAR